MKKHTFSALPPWYIISGIILSTFNYLDTISLSSLCKHIWRHWIYKMPVRYNLSSVWVRLSIFSQLSIIHVGLCVFSLPISFAMIERICILCLIIIIKSEVWTITHCLGLGHETMVCAVCLSIFFWDWGQPSKCPCATCARALAASLLTN